MEIKKQVTGLYNINNEIKSFTGEIEIINKLDKTAYARWILYDTAGNLIATLIRNYYIGDIIKVTDQDIIKLVIENILKYRIGRKKNYSTN